MRLNLCAIVCLIALLPVSSFADYPEVSTRVEPTSATIGQRVTFTISIVAPELQRLSFQELVFDKNSSWTLVEKIPPKDEKVSDSVWRRTLQYKLAAFDIGEAMTPETTVTYAMPNAAIVSQSIARIPVQIHSVLPPGAIDQAQLSDIKPPVRLPVPRWIYWAAYAAAGLVVLALLVLLWRRYRRKIGNIIHPQKRLDDWALDQLDALERDRLIEQQKVKELYTRLSDTIRLFYGRLYGFNAMDLTSYEMMVRLEQEDLPDGQDGDESMNKTVDHLFEEADLVKFAKLVPDAATCRRALDRGRKIIRRSWSHYDAILRQQEVNRTGSTTGTSHAPVATKKLAVQHSAEERS